MTSKPRSIESTIHLTRDKIFQRLVEEEEQRKRQEQLENDLRFELNQEQYEAQNKEFQIQEMLKRQK